jgi:pre-mRNA-processing factor 39
MADYNYGGSEEENAELRKLETELVRPPQRDPSMRSYLTLGSPLGGRS